MTPEVIFLLAMLALTVAVGIICLPGTIRFVRDRLILFPGRWTMRFTRQLVALLDEGVSLVPALELIRAQQKDRASRAVLARILNALRHGEYLSGALKRHPRLFKPHYLRSVAWAEQTGSAEDLATALRLLASAPMPAQSRAAPEIDPVTGAAHWRGGSSEVVKGSRIGIAVPPGEELIGVSTLQDDSFWERQGRESEPEDREPAIPHGWWPRP